MNEIQMIDFIHDVLLKASEDTECFDYNFLDDEEKMAVEEKQKNIQKAMTLLDLLKEPHIKNLRYNIKMKNF